MNKVAVERERKPRQFVGKQQADGGLVEGIKWVPLVKRNEVTGRLVTGNVLYDGLVSARTMNRINFQFLDIKPDEFFFPVDPMRAYNEILALIESKARLIFNGEFVLKRSNPETYLVHVASHHMYNFHHKVVKPLRAEYRLMEKTLLDIAERNRIERRGNAAEGADVGGEACLNAIECTAEERIQPFTGELRSGTPLHIRAERAFNRIVEYLFRIRHTDHAVWETLITVVAAMIVTDCNKVEAAQLAGFSKTDFYRKWPVWRQWFLAAARERR